MSLAHKFNKLIRAITPAIESPEAMTIDNANALSERYAFSSLLPYRFFDDERNLIEMDSPKGDSILVGFAVELQPLMAAGKDAEASLEAVILNAPADTVIMYGTLAHKGVGNALDSFVHGRTQQNKDPLLQELAHARARWMKSKTDESISERQRLFVRDVSNYVFVTCKYHGDLDDEKEIDDWILSVLEYRNSALGSFDGAGLHPRVMTRASFDSLMKVLCNPQSDHSALVNDTIEEDKWPKDMVLKQTRTRVLPTGAIKFSDGEGNATVAVPMTVDVFPTELTLFHNHAVMGNIMSGEDRIPNPYWLYTIIDRPDPGKARDSANMRLGFISKQCLSDSEWYKQMMPHLFERRNDTQKLLGETRQNRQIVRVMTGVTIFCDEDRARRDADYVASLWTKVGYRLSRETYISLPIYLASMPFCYSPDVDGPTHGLMRGHMVSSLNATTTAMVQGDWKGNAPWRDSKSGHIHRAGLPLISRRGQFALIDIFNSSTSYNFAVIATSGAGKSFFTNELVLDMLSRDGIVRLFDVGRSYKKLCERLGGQYIEFDVANPMSINPFWGLSDQKAHPEGFDIPEGLEGEDAQDHGEFGEMIGLLKEVLSQMAYPLGDIPNFEYQLIEDALVETHRRVGYRMGTKDIYDTLVAYTDERAQDLALHLKPFAVGRYATWFNGEPQLHFKNRFVVLEMEELNQDKELRSVILLLAISAVARDIYLMPRGIRKCMIVDEAWDLLSDVRGAKMIETAYRRIRKYGGAAGIITQSLADAEISPAAKAAFANAPWRFLLKQAASSIAYAAETGIIGKDEWLLELLGTVTATPYYSEMLILNDAGGGVFRFPVDRETYYTYTTNPSDLARMEALEKTGMKDEEIVRLLAEEDYQRQREQAAVGAM